MPSYSLLSELELSMSLGATQSRVKSKNVAVFFDESSDSDGTMHGIGGLVVPMTSLASLEIQLHKLRKKMRLFLYNNHYTNLFSPEFANGATRKEAASVRLGGLPKIHATDLWGTKNLFKTSYENFGTHVRWMKKLVKLLQQHNCHFFTRIIIDPEISKMSHIVNRAYFIESNVHKHFGINFETFEKRFLKQSNFGLTVESMYLLEKFLDKDTKIHRIVGDGGNPSQQLAISSVVKVAYEQGIIRNYPIPEFPSSVSENLLQAVDVCLFFFMRDFWRRHDDPKTSIHLDIRNEVMKIWTPVSVVPSMTRHQTVGREAPDLNKFILAILWEMLLLHSGGSPSSVPERKLLADALILKCLQS
ncbi:DUF3800 domain-containing protein [Deinococcus oregonensis]|uniref:DUF3800 domain-containing protein n=2 Tax=Deinococcus oregonensis TaxID=1805970 RepID=A0ABV6B2Z0_9DEIO